MAAFASCRRSGWVRLLVVILCALFIFATVATPPAYAVGESVALFGAAAVLSAAVAALGFKLSNDSDGIATLNKMVSDFAKEAWALNVLVVGNRINGLIDGMNYIKMAVHNGKTYLDERVVAWCQQWLGNNGVYDAGSSSVNSSYYDSLVDGSVIELSFNSFSSVNSAFSSFISDSSYDPSVFSSIISKYSLSLDGSIFTLSYGDGDYNIYVCDNVYESGVVKKLPLTTGGSSIHNAYAEVKFNSSSSINAKSYSFSGSSFSYSHSVVMYDSYLTPAIFRSRNINFYYISSTTSLLSSGNDTGLSGTDTIGADYKDKTLDQILDGLKTWAQDWYDAGADSATNTATGALDLPVTVGDQAATANPALNPDVVYNPPFSIPWPGVRSGETSSGAISDGKANADAAETATTDVAENQTVIDSLVNWALNYINPDTGLFSKFPLCVPYDAYLLVTSSLGVDAVGSDSIFGASPGDLDGVVSQDIETYSDFQPIINIKHDFELDGATYPIELTIDLTPWQPLVTFFREGMALLLVAELIGAEFKRIRGH